MRKPFWGLWFLMLSTSVWLVSCSLSNSAEKKLCEAAFTMSVESGIPQLPVLMLTINDWSADGWERMTHPLIPAPEDTDAKTLVCIRQSRTKTDDVYYLTIGGSQSSTPADATPYQLTWDVRLVELPTGRVIASQEFQGSDPPDTVSISDSNKHIDIYGDEPTTALFKMLSPVLGPIFFTGHAIQEIAFSPDGRFLASAGEFNLDLEDPLLMMWDVSSGEIAVTFDNPDSTGCLAFSPDGRSLATCDIKKKLRVWDTASGKLLYEVEAGDYLRTVAYSPDGSLLAAGHGEALLVMDAASGAIIYTRAFDNVVSLAFSPDGNTLAVGSNEPVQFLSPGSGEELGTLPVSGNYHLSFSSDGRWLVTNGTSTGSSALRLWGVEDHKLLQTFEDGLGFVIAPDGDLIAQGQLLSGEVFLWDTNTGEQVGVITGFKGSIKGLAISPDGKWLAIGSEDDGMIFLHDMTNAE